MMSKRDGNINNDVQHNLGLEFSEEFLFDQNDEQFFIELPYPVHVPLKATTSCICRKFVDEKIEYNEIHDTVRRRYAPDKESVGETVILQKGFLDFHLIKDPDPWFNMDYNIFYTGNLQKATVHGSDYLIRPDCDNKLCLNNVNTDFGEVLKLPIQFETPILGLHSVQKFDHCILTIRERFNITVLKILSIDYAEILWSTSLSLNKSGYLEAQLNAKNTSHLGMIVLNSRLQVNDISTSDEKIVYSMTFKSKKHTIKQFQFYKDSELILMEDYKIKMVNYQINETYKVFKTNVSSCNSFCNFRLLGYDLLIVARHSVLRTDVRYFEESTIFSHTLSHAPCLVDVFQDGEDKFLCTASHNLDESILFTGNTLMSIPYRVPGVNATLVQARLKNDSLVLIPNLEERINFSNTGIKMLSIDDDIFLYTCNSLGELFRQKVSKHEYEINTEMSVHNLCKWIEHLVPEQPVLNVTALADMSMARFALTNPSIMKNQSRYGAASIYKAFLKNNLAIYRKSVVSNVLAADFISIWEDDDDDYQDFGPEDAMPEVPVHEKVASWMERQEFQGDLHDNN